MKNRIFTAEEKVNRNEENKERFQRVGNYIILGLIIAAAIAASIVAS